jgi:hypothetical protein
VRYSDSARDMARRVGEFFAGLWETAKTTFGGIVDAIRAGEMELAWQITLAGMDLAWKQLVFNLTDAWVGFKGFFVDAWHQAIAGVKSIFNDFTAWIATRIADMTGGIVDALNFMGADIQFDPAGTKRAIDEDRQRETDRLAEAEQRRQALANEFREAQMAGARAAMEAARAELDALRKRAADAAGRMGGTGAGGGAGPRDSMLNAGADWGGMVRGLFSGPYGQALGLGDKVDQQIAKNTAATAKAADATAKGVAALAGALTFK